MFLKCLVFTKTILKNDTTLRFYVNIKLSGGMRYDNFKIEHR